MDKDDSREEDIGAGEPEGTLAIVPVKVKTKQGNTIITTYAFLDPGRSDTIRWIKPVVTANRISVVEIEELLKQQVKLDFPEHQHKERLEMSREDHKFMESVSNSVKLVDGHYSIGLPLKEKGLDFPNNRRVAEQKDKANQSKRSWYIPHHGVYHPKKRKLRVVFDCGATYQGTSLNARLLQGPDLTNSLIGVLTRFRQKNIAFMADIEAMFHQVPEEDSDLLTFLWWPDGDLSSELEEYQMVVHIFGATSSPSCANFALQQCARDNVDDFSPEAVSSMLRNFYVDDCLKSMEDERKAVIIAHELKTLCNKGGFKLNKWVSNSRALLQTIPEESRSKEIKDLDLDKSTLPVERALGVQWCTETDSFHFKFTPQDKPLTRRGILSVVSSIFDPLGMLSPVILPAKQI
ncbi:uncharacterized protein LOC117536983 [Gymnodraco acuticeps]|uniref:Uncharacterized protein LOC117536983 n=1 Tax=Gymnodraco acuticeps TaxID=8218 RepID=A0A6P8TL50_GYMAC|nr:uncharacterized protein LOC117536983 [Gymnodraco acuticeps]